MVFSLDDALVLAVAVLTTMLHCNTCEQPPCAVLQRSTWSLTRNSSTSLWPTTSRPTTCLHWRSWPRASRSSWAAIGWPSSSPETSASPTTRFAKTTLLNPCLMCVCQGYVFACDLFICSRMSVRI